MGGENASHACVGERPYRDDGVGGGNEGNHHLETEEREERRKKNDSALQTIWKGVCADEKPGAKKGFTWAELETLDHYTSSRKGREVVFRQRVDKHFVLHGTWAEQEKRAKTGEATAQEMEDMADDEIPDDEEIDEASEICQSKGGDHEADGGVG